MRTTLATASLALALLVTGCATPPKGDSVPIGNVDLRAGLGVMFPHLRHGPPILRQAFKGSVLVSGHTTGQALVVDASGNWVNGAVGVAGHPSDPVVTSLTTDTIKANTTDLTIATKDGTIAVIISDTNGDVEFPADVVVKTGSLDLQGATSAIMMGGAAANKIDFGTGLATLNAAGLVLKDSLFASFGTGADAAFRWSTPQTANALVLGIEGGSNPEGGALLIVENSNVAGNYAHAFETDPTIIVHSRTAAGSATDEWISLQHDTTEAVLASGKGDIALNSAAASGTRFTRSVATRTADIVLTVAAHSSQVQSNEGSALGAGLLDATLPAAVAGATFELVSIDEDGWVITAQAGDTIQLDGAITVGGGAIATINTHTQVILVAVDATQWIATTDDEHLWTIDGVTTGVSGHGQAYVATPASVNADSIVAIGGTWADSHLESFTRSGGEITYTGVSPRHFGFAYEGSADVDGPGDTGDYTVSVVVNNVAVPGATATASFSNQAQSAQFGLVAILELYTGSTIQVFVTGAQGAGGNDITFTSSTLTLDDAGH